MEIEKNPIEGLFKVVLEPHTDHRGFFAETFRMSQIREAISSPEPFVQGCHSRSTKGVLRGLHAEPWGKFVYVVRGEAFVAVVDLREDSKTFGKTHSLYLGEGNRTAMYVPRGLAHGFMALSDIVDYTYLFTEEYSDKPRRAVRWDDPDLGIAWPQKSPILSEGDKKNPSMRDLFPGKFG